MTHGWTPERRKKQSKAIRKWKPWEKSTGPKTEEGKEKSKMNAQKHGMRSAEFRLMESLLAAYRSAELKLRNRLKD
jgi:hypothetical protein